ncbi:MULTISPECIES: DUF262 domain-containing protein [Campylobacter]|jgi:hypothetical protein APCC8_24573|uniref:DUF262 domain-containing protein n=1 Tax=Campylobacter TaxID=194 RepID=UPI00027A36F5|nr:MULTISPECIES: DUF262 domain-containing protein [Campylobacter]EJP74751.1 PF03235 family protein [Campylobacter sp. FOBRC14]
MDSYDVERDIVECDEEVDSENGSYDISYKLTSYGMDLPADVLFYRYQGKQMYLPDFQRNYVWNKKQASKFIESLLLGLPIPGIFLYKEKNEKMLILDGYQRIESLARYRNNLFENNNFKLSGVNEIFNNRNYQELSDREQNKINNSIIHATIIQADDPEDKNYHAVYEVFERLNTGGIKLSPQEVRNCVADGDFRKRISELANNKDVKNFLSISNKRKKDEEVVLRLIALCLRPYSGNMKQFLNSFMFDNKDLIDKNVKQVLENFISIVQFMDKIQANKYFKVNDKLSLAILDSIWVSVYKNYDNLKNISVKIIKQKLDELMKDSKYENAIKTGTTHNKTSVDDRLKKAVEFLQNV